MRQASIQRENLYPREALLDLLRCHNPALIKPINRQSHIFPTPLWACRSRFPHQHSVLRRCTFRQGASRATRHRARLINQQTTADRHQPASKQRVPSPSAYSCCWKRGRLKMLNPQASTFSVGERGMSDLQTHSSKAALHKKKSSGSIKVFVDKEKTKSNQQASTRL